MREGKPARSSSPTAVFSGYDGFVSDLIAVLSESRRASARTVNSIMTATYWEVGRRIVDFEQGGKMRAGYGDELIRRLARDLTGRFGRGFSARNLHQMRLFYRIWPISQTLSAQFGEGPESGVEIWQTPSAKSRAGTDGSGVNSRALSAKPRGRNESGANACSSHGVRPEFLLTWSHYVRLMAVKNNGARQFYEAEALRGGWTVRQLDRQIGSQFFERVALSRNKEVMLERSAKAATTVKTSRQAVEKRTPSPEEAFKDPYVLEFLDLKDEYSESDLEQALIRRLESFLLELGGEFTFVGRQRRLRIGDSWYRVDLLLFHRRLRCLVIVDLKLDKFTHADAGQMHMYCNYAREHWTLDGENPPVGLILCAAKDAAVAHYALEGLPNKVLAAEYRTTLPDAKVLAEEMERTRRLLEEHTGRG